MLVTFLQRPWWPFDVNPLKLAWSSGGLVCRDKETPYLVEKLHSKDAAKVTRRVR